MRLLAIAALTLLAAPAGATADELPVKALPGNKPCPYPAEAQRLFVAGPVRFVVQVRPDGTAASVEVRKVPQPDVGFEDTVQACVSEWRFEAAGAGEAALRDYQGHLRFRLDAAEESAIRALLETLATSWNTGDLKAVEDLAVRPGDSEAVLPDPPPSVREQLEGERPADPWRMELQPDVERLRFLRPDVVNVRQFYRRIAGGQNGQAPKAEEAVLDAFMAKGSRGWRLAKVSSVQSPWLEPVRVGGRIREPRKVRHASPRYPEAAKASGIQGVVILDCVISPEGKVTSVTVLRGVHKLLDDAAVEAVRQWEYTPTLLDGERVPVIMTVTVNFRLSS